MKARSGLVLVMDGDQRIRNLLAAMLRVIGYTASTCSTGEEAIELYKKGMETGRPFLTAIMGLIVSGGMGGEDAAREILRIDPGARLIVSTGYSGDSVPTEYRRHGFYLALPKPYKVCDVAAVLMCLRSD